MSSFASPHLQNVREENYSTHNGIVMVSTTHHLTVIVLLPQAGSHMGTNILSTHICRHTYTVYVHFSQYVGNFLLLAILINHQRCPFQIQQSPKQILQGLKISPTFSMWGKYYRFKGFSTSFLSLAAAHCLVHTLHLFSEVYETQKIRPNTWHLHGINIYQELETVLRWRGEEKYLMPYLKSACGWWVLLWEGKIKWLVFK